jgi:hypothetical protein
MKQNLFILKLKTLKKSIVKQSCYFKIENLILVNLIFKLAYLSNYQRMSLVSKQNH